MTVPPEAEAAAAARARPSCRAERRRAHQARRRLRRRRWQRGVTVACALIVLGTLGVVGAVASGRLHLAFVRSGSMRPTIPVGALAVYVPASGDDLAPGDIIAFHPPGRRGVVTHRIVAAERHRGTLRFVTRGDANSAADRWKVPERSTGWRYVARVPLVGYVVGYLATAVARTIVIVSLAGFVLWELWRPRASVAVPS